MKSYLTHRTSLPILVYTLLLAFFYLLSSANIHASEQTDILVVTGGHAYDTAAFEKLFTLNDRIKVDMIDQPEANQAMSKGRFKNYDAVVFYDMWQDISEGQKEAFIELTKQGVGLVFLHHSLVSYQEWNKFEKIIGGRYLQKDYVEDPAKASGFKHDIEMNVKIRKPNHPVTGNMKHFTIVDEGYSNLKVLPSVETLLIVDHQHCAKKVAWTNQYNNSKIVYLLFGHGNTAFQNKNYQSLLFNAIGWVARIEK